MANSQSFLNGYELNAAPTDGGNFTFKNSGSKTNITVGDTLGTDNTSILGDVGTDLITSTINNGQATYWGIGTVGGVQGIIVLENGNKYYFLTSQTLATGATGTAAQSTAGTNTWTLAGTDAPTAPTFTVSDNAGSIQNNNLAAGSRTDDTTLTLSGTAGAGATIKIYDGAISGTPIGTVTANSNGSWSYTTSTLLQGAHTLNVTQTGTAGTTSSATGFGVTVDTTAPSAPTVGSAVDDAGTVTGSLVPGGVTDDTTPTLNIILPANAVAGDTVKVLNGADQVGSYVLTAADISAGKASVTTAAISGNGAKTLTATITDAAGNASTTGSFSYTLDKAAPAVTSIAASGAGITAGSGSLNAGKTVTFTVNASEALTVTGTPTLTLSNGAAATYTGGGGSNALTFSYTVAAGQDAADLAVTALNGTVRDAAGNAVAFNAGAVGNPAGTLAIDTTAPTATTTIGLAQDTGAAGDGTSSNPALTGTVSTGEAGVTVTIRDGGTVIGTATTGDGGVWTFANADATDAAHSYTASMTDAAGNAGGSAATSPATTTVDKAADGNVAVDLTDASAAAGGASVQFDLSGLDAGSTASVTFTGSGGGTVTRSYTADGTQTADVSGLQGDVTATVLVSDRAGNTAAGAGDALAADPVCFMPGTLVATPSGERAVETLRAGDLVLTACGRAAPVRWLGRQTVSTRFADPLRVLPVRIAAGALGENLPRRDLLVSADHALLVDGILVQAGALVDGAAIRREAAVPEVFTYWHVELADHALVLAEGVPAETFVDNVARLAFDNWDEHEAAGSEAPVAEMALPRAKSRRQVPAGTRRRLAERAALLLGGRTAAA